MEGPSIFILKEEAKIFKGKKVLEAEGYGKIDTSLLKNKTVKDIKSWGKHFLICFSDFTIRIHFGLFGNYRLNEHKEGINASLHLKFSNGELNCYIAHIKLLSGPINKIYDWRLDMLSEKWDPLFVKKVLIQQDGKQLIGDLLLNPDLFSGVGNMIRNEVLYRTKTHPASKLENIPASKLTAIIKETKIYSSIFKNALLHHSVKKTLQVYQCDQCPKGHKIEMKKAGKTKRNIFVCSICQKLYT